MSDQNFYLIEKTSIESLYNKAIIFARDLADEDNDKKQIIILIESKLQAKPFLQKLFDSRTLKEMYNGTTLNDSQHFIKIETKEKFKDDYDSTIVIAFFLDSDFLCKIEKFDSIIAIIAVSHLPNRLEKWIAQFNALDI